MQRFLIFLISSLGWISPLFANVVVSPDEGGPLPINHINDVYDLSGKMLIGVDSTHSWNIEEVLSKSGDFMPVEEVGKTSGKYAYWGRIEIANTENVPVKWVMQVGDFLTNRVTVYYANDRENGFTVKKAGNYMPLEQREIKQDNKPQVYIDFGPYEKKTIFFSIDNRPTNYPPELAPKLTYINSWHQKQLFSLAVQASVIAIFLLLALYNFFIYLQSLEKVYLHYSLFITAAFTAATSSQMFIPNLLGGDLVATINYGVIAGSLCLCVTFLMSFTRLFLNLNESLPGWDKAASIVAKVSVLGFLATVIVWGVMRDYYITRMIYRLVTVSLFVSLLILLVRVAVMRNKLGYYFMGGMAIFITLGIMLQFVSTEYTIAFYEMGAVSQLLLFSVGLGYRMKLDARKKEKMQGQIIDQLRETERIQLEANQELELKVQERTQEVIAQNEELQQQQEEIMAINDKLTLRQGEVQKMNEEMEGALMEIQESQQKLTDSLRYARQIQETIQFRDDELDRDFSEFFVFYKPKDIVSGDFYWYGRAKGHKFLVVADCTGHGVPAAFLTLVGQTLLDEIINLKGIYEVDQILHEMDKGIKKILHQAESNNTDGMDVCICRIDDENGAKHIRFAGAKRPLYFVQHGKLRVIRGSKFSLGGFRKKEKKFVAQRIALSRGDMLYLTSDGLVDQNNPEGKKFGSEAFMETLQIYQSLDLKKQEKVFEEAFSQHINGMQQRDDITILGVKL